MKVNELKQGYYMFGNKGNLWSNTAHICKSGTMGGTICGTPTLSRNWCEMEGVQEIGCPKCLEAYKKEMLEKTLGVEFERG